MKKIISNCFFLVCGLVLCHAQDGNWTTFKHMPTSRQEMPCAVLNGKIYVSGGIIIASTNKTEVYDPVSDSWSLGKAMPDSRHHHLMVTVNEKIYVLGGFKSVLNFDARDDVWEYDEQLDEWISKSPIPVKSGSGAAVNFNDKIYLFGGSNDNDVLDINYTYDPSTDEWEALAPMPTLREHLTATVLDTLIYVIGGRGSFDAGIAVEAYSPSTDSWMQLATLPTPRSGLSAGTLHGRIYVFGGEGGGVHDENEEYDPLTDSWRSMPPMPVPRHGFTACILNDMIFLPGGATFEGFGPSNVLDAFSMEVVSGMADQMNIIGHHADSKGNGVIVISLELYKSTSLTIRLISLDGKSIHEPVYQYLNRGQHQLQFLHGNLAPGIYLYTIESDGRIVNGHVLLK